MKWSLIMLALLLMCTTVQQNADGWPMFQHDPQHSGYSSSPMPESLKRVWMNERSESDYDRVYSLVISGERLFVSTPFSLHALDMNTGSLVKEYRVSTQMSFPAVEGNTLCLNSHFGVVCVDTESGDTLWRLHAQSLGVSSFPIIVDGHVFVGGGNAPLYPDPRGPGAMEEWERALRLSRRVLCIEAETGEPIWEFYANSPTEYSPAYFGGRIYVNDGIEVFCLDAQTGEKIWHTIIGWNSSSSLSLDGERVFIVTYEGIVCLDMETGEILWKSQCDKCFYRTPAAAYGKVFAFSDRTLYCLDAESGKLKWKREVESSITSELVVADGKVAFGTAEGMLYIVKAGSGKVCESLDLGDSPVRALALSDGKLIVGEEIWKITCFEGSPKPLTRYLLVPLVAVAGTALLFAIVLWYQKKKKGN